MELELTTLLDSIGCQCDKALLKQLVMILDLMDANGDISCNKDFTDSIKNSRFQ